MIKTWQERCEIHPDHQTGMITYQMIQNRMQEEIDDLRDALEKTLTDEEIKEVIANIAHYGNIAKDDYVSFARAILKKAQEK